MTERNTAQSYQPSWRRRLLDWLLPVETHWPDEWFRDVEPPSDLITSRTEITLSWRDRWRILLSGRAELEVQTETKAPVHIVQSDSVFRSGTIL